MIIHLSEYSNKQGLWLYDCSESLRINVQTLLNKKVEKQHFFRLKCSTEVEGSHAELITKIIKCVTRTERTKHLKQCTNF